MGIFNTIGKKVKKKIKETVEHKREMDKVYQKAYDDQYKVSLKQKAKQDAKDKLDPNKKTKAQPMFKQGLIDSDNDKALNWKLGQD